ncbi:unnamed protein product [Merluccius merluccius]
MFVTTSPEKRWLGAAVSPELESLQCYNDYNSHVYCQWREEPSEQARTPLQLWNWNQYENRESLCESSSGPSVPQRNHDRWRHCRYTTSYLAINIKNTFFFKTAAAAATPSCPSSRHSLDLSQQLRVRPPVDLSVRDSEDGQQLIQWSSPYPASPPLSSGRKPSLTPHNLTYQLSYSKEDEDTWSLTTLKETRWKVRLHPGCWYEARVRAMGEPGGLWSEWSPRVAWKTPEAADQIPSMQCVLDGEEKVTCSWEMRKELAHFITYQLACRHKRTQAIESCCVRPEVTPVFHRGEALLRYSCPLTSAHPLHLTVELIPMRNTRSFPCHRHIRPNRLINVSVAEKGGNWIVKWEDPNPKLALSYQVRYRNSLNEYTHLNVSGGFKSLIIPGSVLDPSRRYQVQVRALLNAGDKTYAGIPSEWTKPEEWHSHEGPLWSPQSLFYVGLIVMVLLIFLAFLFSIQVCRRKLRAWLQSSPSPDKSHVFSEIKNLSCHHVLLQKEDMDICKVHHLDSISTCSSSKTTRDKGWDMSFSLDEGCLDCDHLSLPDLSDQTDCSGTSAVSFNGPYIFCESTPKPPQDSADDQQEVKDTNDAPPGSGGYVLTAGFPQPLPPTAAASQGLTGDYVFLPASASMQFTATPHEDAVEPSRYCTLP